MIANRLFAGSNMLADSCGRRVPNRMTLQSGRPVLERYRVSSSRPFSPGRLFGSDPSHYQSLNR